MALISLLVCSEKFVLDFILEDYTRMLGNSSGHASTIGMSAIGSTLHV